MKNGQKGKVNQPAADETKLHENIESERKKSFFFIQIL